jgi:hypothetical protein
MGSSVAGNNKATTNLISFLLNEYGNLVEEGYVTLPPIDTERYVERPGLEGPFRQRNGKVLYYDPKEGKYYDSDTDMYISYDEYQAMNEDQQLKAYDPSKGSWYVDDDGKVVANLPPEDDQNGFFGGW